MCFGERCCDFWVSKRQERLDFHIANSWSIQAIFYFDPTQNMSFLSPPDATILQVFVDVCFFCWCVCFFVLVNSF